MPSPDPHTASASLPGTIALDTGWQFACSAPQAWADAAAVRDATLPWQPARVPGTVAHSLGASIEEPGLHDAHDWWYRCEFAAPVGSSARTRLRFDGLATLAEVWLNGQPLLQSDNMFVPCSADVGTLLAPTNELLICLRSLDHALKTRRPRPRWKTSLVPAQNLRHVRTTLLGRMPGWNPPVHPVGVWKPVWLDTPTPVALASRSMQAQVEGSTGLVTVKIGLQLAEGARVEAARCRVGTTETSLAVDQASQDGAVVFGSLTLPDAPLWWPHTHGKPVTLPCQIDVQVDGQWHTLPAGRVGFRDLRVERGDGLVQFQVNGEAVFCRGACWTTDDLLRLHGDETALRRTLELARDAGLNMLRVGGTMAYESDAFYTLCDELGILVWQDFMFANMDYPVADEGFLANITREAEHQLQRLHAHPCVAAYCGSSEVEQQAAMLGLPASDWSNPFFNDLLPALCARWHAGVPYFRSSPSEGALPFHVATGIAHYYGVGAYKRPLADVKSAGVKFASECLGFSHVPAPETIALMMDGSTPPAHHPLWKARQPRDVGAGWDFEDTRDHYLRELFGLDPVTLRSHGIL